MAEHKEGGNAVSGEDRFEVAYRQGHSLSLNRQIVLVDRETGVNYLFMQNGYAGGMTPLLDADGKPIVTGRASREGREAEQ